MNKNNFNWINIGNDRAIEFLDKSLKNDQLANFYIFSGPVGLGKFSLAKNFAKNIFTKDKPDLIQKENFLEINSDFMVVEREDDKKNISIKQIRDLIGRLKSSSFLNSYKIAVIKNAEDLNDNSANALLKILEESNHKTIIILTVNDAEGLPRTILSRAQVINFYPVKDDVIYKNLIDNFAINPSLSKNITRLSAGRPSLAIKFLQEEATYKSYQDIAEKLLDFLPANFAERIKIAEELSKKNDILSVEEILAIWQSVLRDLILVDFGQYDLVRNEFIIERLKNFRDRGLNVFELRNKISYINLSRIQHQANINFRSILDYIAVNI